MWSLEVGVLEEGLADLMRGVSELLLSSSNSGTSSVDTSTQALKGSSEVAQLLQQRVDTLEALMTSLKLELTARAEHNMAQAVVTNCSLNKLRTELADIRSERSSPSQPVSPSKDTSG